MVAEESGMNFQAGGKPETVENPLPAGPVDDSRTQIALAFDSGGNAQLVAESPTQHDGRRVKRARYDTRRTAEYLAGRGRLPAEALHLITRRTLAEAIAYIRKHVPGATHQWAADYYLRCIDMLMPYAHVKQSDLEGAGDQLPSLLAGHFLAAQAFGRGTTIDAPRGAGAMDSNRSQLFDSAKAALQADDKGAHTMPHTTTGAVITLPPRGRD